MFTDVHTDRFPCQHYQMGIYLSLIDACGTYNFQIDLVHLDTETLIGQGILDPMHIPDRLRPAEIGVTLQNLVFQAPGRYEFRLLGNGKFIEQKEFSVVELPSKGA